MPRETEVLRVTLTDLLLRDAFNRTVSKC
jgi:hypothetical protein